MSALTYDSFVGLLVLSSPNREDHTMHAILSRSYYRNDHQHLEQVLRTSSGEFEVIGHAAGPRGGPYRYPVSIAELARMSNDVAWER